MTMFKMVNEIRTPDNPDPITLWNGQSLSDLMNNSEIFAILRISYLYPPSMPKVLLHFV